MHLTAIVLLEVLQWFLKRWPASGFTMEKFIPLKPVEDFRSLGPKVRIHKEPTNAQVFHDNHFCYWWSSRQRAETSCPYSNLWWWPLFEIISQRLRRTEITYFYCKLASRSFLEIKEVSTEILKIPGKGSPRSPKREALKNGARGSSLWFLTLNSPLALDFLRQEIFFLLYIFCSLKKFERT